MMGYDFHRQKPVDEYIVDFFCHELLLVIEIDGSSHNEDTFEYDENRQKQLEEKFGLSFLRFYDGNVRNNLSDVVNSIRGWIIEHTSNRTL